MLFIRDVTELIASIVSDADVDRNPYILCNFIDMCSIDYCDLFRRFRHRIQTQNPLPNPRCFLRSDPFQQIDVQCGTGYNTSLMHQRSTSTISSALQTA